MVPDRDRGDWNFVVMVKLPVEDRRCPNADGLMLGSVNFVFKTFHDERVFLLARDMIWSLATPYNPRSTLVMPGAVIHVDLPW
jgi:hypothetical protein